MAAMDAAQAQVALKYDPQQAAAQRAIQAIQGQTAANEAGLNQYGDKGRATIGSVYDTLGSLLTGNRAQSKTDLSNQAALVGQGYDQANAYQNQVADAGRQRLSGMAGALGAGNAGNLQVQTGLESALANILGQNGQARAAATGNLNTWGGQWDQILGNGINIGEQTRAKTAGDFETELLGLLGQNKVTGLEGENAQYGKLSDILGQRQNDLVATYNQLAQQEWENSFRQAQLDQEAASKNASLSLQAQGMADDNAFRNSQAAKDGQLSEKDLLNLFMQQQGMADDRMHQGNADTLAMKDFGLREMAANQGKTNPGQELLTSLMFGDNADLYNNPDTGGDNLAQAISQMELLGYDTSFLRFPAQTSAPPPPPTSGGSGGSGWKEFLPFVGPWAPATASLGIGKQLSKLFK